ncbi:MAG: InlB B-repeat-containing protein [Clostridia bacterium]|nr:InlB B-repeat-containing protein [Clostridia bacterium]
MKKILCVLTAFVLLLGMFSALGAVASNLGEVVFYNEKGETITALDGCDTVTAKVSFTPNQKNTAQVLVSRYRVDGTLTGMDSITDVSVASGQTNEYTTPAISVSDTELLKVFCWDSTDSLTPFTAVGEIERNLLENLPTATVSELEISKVTDVNLLCGLNFKADPVSEAQLAFYSDWYADFEITLNKTATFNLDGSKDGYLAGQYDSWSPAWVQVPKMDITLQANTPLKIMETAAESYGKPGLKYTYGEVYERVKDFDCGVFFSEEYLLENPDLQVSLALRIYHPEEESISYTIGEVYTYLPEIPVVTKFIPKENLSYEMQAGSPVTLTLGDLFSETGYEIKTVTVTGADEVVVHENWAESTLTFQKGGIYTVTVTDSYYCNPATATITITELAPPQVEKFDTKFINHETYLYRIGNQNTVALGSIFKALDGVTVGSVNVEVEALENTPSVSATYTENTDWTKSTLKFNGTGVVKVTISDEESRPYSLYLEIVDAKNVTTATSATANNVVLLNDISGTFNVSNGYAFYGNGFTVTCSGKGNPGLKLLTSGFINVSKGGILDNTRILCDVFPESYLYTSDASGYDYFKSAVLLTDDSTISNCYIYGARCNIFIGGGNATVKNTVTESGSFANIQVVRSSDAFTVTLEDVTTIQYMTTSSYDPSKNVMGLGIAVGDSDTKSNPYILLKGDLKQYNWVTSDHSSVSNSYAKGVLEVALKESAYQHTVNGKNTVNLGIAYITSYPANIIDERTNKAEIPYSLNKVSFLGATGRVYSVAAGSAVTADYRYNPETDGVIPYNCGGNGWYEPQIHPNATLGGQYIANTDGCDKYCYLDSDTLKVMIPAGESMKLDFTKIFDINKYAGQDLQTQISCIDEDGTAVSLTNGTLTVSDAKEYTVTYTLTDTIFYNQNGEAVPQTVTYTKKLPVSVALKDTSTPNAEFEFDSTKQVIYYNKALLGDKVQFMPFLAGLKIYDYMGDTRYLRFDGDNNAYQKVVSATIENLNTTGEAKGYHIITVKLTDGGVLKIDLDVKATSGGSTHSGSIKTNKNIFYVVNDGGTANSGQIWRVYDYEFTGNNGVVINSGAVNFGTSGVDASSATKPTGTFSATVSATVTYDANGGLCGQSVGYQTNYYNTLTLPNPTRYGYVFAGWYNEPYQGTRVGGAGDSYTPSGDVTLYAQWGKPCTVTFDATGGSVTPETVNYNGEQIVLPLPTKSGYWFTGWYEDADCTKRYGMDGVILNPTKNTTLYAGWSPVYTVTYDATGGSVTPTSQDYTGTILTLPLPSDPARAFAGWYTAETGGTFIGMGNDTYLPTEHITLYAHWEAPSVVTYDANGGTCATGNETYMGTPLTLPTPQRTGYTFQGWYTAASGGTKVGDAGANYTPNGSIALYAQWIKTPYTIKVNTNNATVTGVTNGQTAYYGDTVTVTVTFSESRSLSLTVTDSNGNELLNKSAAGTYTFTMPASNVTVSASSSGSCFTEDTLITMGDGSKKAVKEITKEDTILSYNFFTGEYEAKDVALFISHGVDTYEVANLTFSDGTTLRIVGDHGVFDYDLNEYVYFTVDNMDAYIGHTFVKENKEGYDLVTLVKAEKTEETLGIYSLTSAGNANAFAEGMLTMAPPGDFYNWIKMGEKLRYDTESFQKDIETYGLYTFEDFGGLVTYEQFEELNGAYLKIAVEKGIFTWDYIVELIGMYL